MTRSSVCHLSTYLAYTNWKYNYKRLRLAKRTVSWILCAQIDLLECRCINFVAKFTHDPVTPLYCASLASAFFGFLGISLIQQHFFFCSLHLPLLSFSCLLFLKAEPVSKILPLILKLFCLVELTKFEISVYFTTKLHFRGLLIYILSKNSHRDSVSHKELKNVSDNLTHWWSDKGCLTFFSEL
jgi:hypothetical protein